MNISELKQNKKLVYGIFIILALIIGSVAYNQYSQLSDDSIDTETPADIAFELDDMLSDVDAIDDEDAPAESNLAILGKWKIEKLQKYNPTTKKLEVVTLKPQDQYYFELTEDETYCEVWDATDKSKCTKYSEFSKEGNTLSLIKDKTQDGVGDERIVLSTNSEDRLEMLVESEESDSDWASFTIEDYVRVK
jgi:hypothetical protein